jgi:hypothetical protein
MTYQPLVVITKYSINTYFTGAAGSNAGSQYAIENKQNIICTV